MKTGTLIIAIIWFAAATATIVLRFAGKFPIGIEVRTPAPSLLVGLQLLLLVGWAIPALVWLAMVVEGHRQK